MIYVFDTAQNMQACCGCPITADGLLTLQISSNLAPNPVGSLTILMDGSIRIVSTLPNSIPGLPPGPDIYCDPATSVCCDPAASLTGNTLTPASELVAWASHIQGTQITESEFQVGESGRCGYQGLLVESRRTQAHCRKRAPIFSRWVPVPASAPVRSAIRAYPARLRRQPRPQRRHALPLPRRQLPARRLQPPPRRRRRHLYGRNLRWLSQLQL